MKTPLYEKNLRHIGQIAGSLKTITAAVLSSESPTRTSRSPESFVLPVIDLSSFNETLSPPELFQDLPPHTAQILSDVYARFSKSIGTRYKLAFRQTCLELVQQVPASDKEYLQQRFANIKAALDFQYRQHLGSAKQLALDALRRKLQEGIVEPSKTKQAFNQEFLPFLEKYFEYNAYPSAADRALIAKKSMMTPRQIEVWFQNHRRRARQDGKTLNKLHASELPRFSIESLERSMPHYIIPEDERVDVDSDVSEYEWQYESDEDDMSAWAPRYSRTSGICNNDVLNPTSPPHAFPTSYSASSRYDPFPMTDGKYTFPSPLWLRQPAAAAIQHQDEDMDEFITAFSRLNVREGPRKHWRKKAAHDPRKSSKPKRTSTPPPKPDRSAATLFITTKPFPARHPAFIQARQHSCYTPDPQRTLPTACAVSVPVQPAVAPAKSLSLSNAPSYPTKEVTRKAAEHRKVAPLPKRLPSNRNVARCDMLNHPTECPTLSHSSLSRTTSLASEFSSRSRTWSLSSSSSCLTTPASSPTALPQQTIVSLSPSLSTQYLHFDPQKFHDAFNNAALLLDEEFRLSKDAPAAADIGPDQQSSIV